MFGSPSDAIALSENYDIEAVNEYILEETSFADDAVGSLQGLYGVEWSAYDVAVAVNSIESESDYRVLDEIGDGKDLAELCGEVDVSGDKLDEFEEVGFIKRTGDYIPTVKKKLLADLYLSKVDRIENI